MLALFACGIVGYTTMRWVRLRLSSGAAKAGHEAKARKKLEDVTNEVPCYDSNHGDSAIASKTKQARRRSRLHSGSTPGSKLEEQKDTPGGQATPTSESSSTRGQEGPQVAGGRTGKHLAKKARKAKAAREARGEAKKVGVPEAHQQAATDEHPETEEAPAVAEEEFLAVSEEVPEAGGELPESRSDLIDLQAQLPGAQEELPGAREELPEVQEEQPGAPEEPLEVGEVPAEAEEEVCVTRLVLQEAQERLPETAETPALACGKLDIEDVLPRGQAEEDLPEAGDELPEAKGQPLPAPGCPDFLEEELDVEDEERPVDEEWQQEWPSDCSQESAEQWPELQQGRSESAVWWPEFEECPKAMVGWPAAEEHRLTNLASDGWSTCWQWGNRPLHSNLAESKWGPAGPAGLYKPSLENLSEEDDWMTPFDELIGGVSFSAPTRPTVCLWSDSPSTPASGEEGDPELFTDGQRRYQRVPTDDGQPLYTDGCQLYAPVCVLVANTPPTSPGACSVEQ